jgi:hypothetical protein
MLCRMKLRTAALAAVLLTLAASHAVAQNETGTVWIYRVEEARKFEGRNATVYLNGKKILSMSESTFIGLRLPVGEYVLGMKNKGSEIPFTVEAGKVYYFRASQTADLGFSQHLYQVEEKQALHHMRDFKPLKAKNVKDKSLALATEKPLP